MNVDESTLIQAAAAGDRTASEALYRRHEERVYAVARRYAGDEDRAWDISQEAWLRAFRALPGFRGDAAFSTWLHRVVVTTALGTHRRTSRRDEKMRALDAPSAIPSHEARTHARIEVERLLARLPERMRMVLILHDLEGYTHDEIGRLLGISAGTSKSQLFRARAKARGMLAPMQSPAHGDREGRRSTDRRRRPSGCTALDVTTAAQAS